MGRLFCFRMDVVWSSHDAISTAVFGDVETLIGDSNERKAVDVFSRRVFADVLAQVCDPDGDGDGDGDVVEEERLGLDDLV